MSPNVCSTWGHVGYSSTAVVVRFVVTAVTCLYKVVKTETIFVIYFVKIFLKIYISTTSKNPGVATAVSSRTQIQPASLEQQTQLFLPPCRTNRPLYTKSQVPYNTAPTAANNAVYPRVCTQGAAGYLAENRGPVFVLWALRSHEQERWQSHHLRWEQQTSQEQDSFPRLLSGVRRLTRRGRFFLVRSKHPSGGKRRDCSAANIYGKLLTAVHIIDTATD